MAKFEIVMPKLGESIIEATITKWLKAEGDMISEDEVICELATDKVDSEIPSPVEGKLIKILCKEGEVVPVGKLIAIIDMDGENAVVEKEATPAAVPEVETPKVVEEEKTPEAVSDKFYSPLVKSIAKQENISIKELDLITGSGKDSRVTKEDVLEFLKTRTSKPTPNSEPAPAKQKPKPKILCRLLLLNRQHHRHIRSMRLLSQLLQDIR